MGSGLPKWTQNPVIVVPLFGVGFAIPFVATLSDRLAAFAGGLAAALAAVVAVVLTGQMQRANDRARQRRDIANSLMRHVRERIAICKISSRAADYLIAQLEEFETARSTEKNIRSVEDWKKAIDGTLQAIDGEELNRLLEMSDAVADALMEYLDARLHVRDAFDPLPTEFGFAVSERLVARMRIARGSITHMRAALDAHREALNADLAN
jgi:hypothetical protein